MDFHVDSETGPSEAGHPAPAGPESEAAHSHEQGRALFDDVLWGKRAREERDAFADTLRDRGVRVISSQTC